MKYKYIILSILLMFFLFPLVQANGLQVNQTSFNITKTMDQDALISFILMNEEPYDFVNISFSENPYIEMDKVDLLSGESKEVFASIITNQDINEDVLIRGFYEADLGISNQTHEIEVDFDNGLSKCDFSIIEGDSVKWSNQVTDSIVLRNAETNEDVATINEGSFYETQFEYSQTFKYHFLRRGFIFTPTCTITILSSEGFVNNPKYDTKIHLNVITNYEPTLLEVNVLEQNYTMDFTEVDEGVFTIKNIGLESAKNIKLSGDWFSFNVNNFNLDEGKTKTVSYTIHPRIYQTNQTDKLHKVNITIEGNFPIVTEQFDIFINHAVIDNEDYQDSEDLIAFITRFCNENPDVCNTAPTIIYRNSNNSDNLFNATMSEAQLRELFKLQFAQFDSNTEIQNWLKDILYNQTLMINNLENSSVENRQNIEDISDGLDANNSTWIFLSMLFVTLIICAILYYIITHWKKRRALDDLNNL